MNHSEHAMRSVARGAIRAEPKSVDRSFRFYAIGLTPKVFSRSAALANWEAFEGIVLALVFSSGGSHAVLGSAVMVAPGVALGAYHVVREHAQKLPTREMSISAMGITSQGPLVWPITSLVCVEGTDVCIMRLKLASETDITRNFYMATMTTRLPATEETVSVSGFVAAEKTFEQALPNTLELSGGMRLTSGSVTESFPQGGRDRYFAPWPALEVDAPLFGGMSGGPVFDSRGALIGLGSSSWDFGIAEDPSPMTVALLWPVLGHPFPTGDDGSGPPTSLMELHAQHAASIERPEAVRISPMPDGVVTTYEPWT